MLPQQKEASFTLISSIVFAVLLTIISPMFNMFRNEAILVLFVLFILTLWIGRKITGLKFKTLDEMDKTIRLQAAIIAIHGFGAMVAIYALALYLIHTQPMLVPVYQVLQLAMYSWLFLYICWSGSILVLYRKGAMHV